MNIYVQKYWKTCIKILTKVISDDGIMEDFFYIYLVNFYFLFLINGYLQ